MSADHEKDPAPSSSLDAPEVMEVKAGMFKDTCLRLLDQVNQREIEVVVTKYGAPVARLVAEGGHMRSAHGFMSGTVLDHGDIVSPDFDAWGDLG
jgi:antitoxin (DNA-binding transcriptional repressor) of toxin-antitoxin stability system